jgi:hypothetical protein
MEKPAEFPAFLLSLIMKKVIVKLVPFRSTLSHFQKNQCLFDKNPGFRQFTLPPTLKNLFLFLLNPFYRQGWRKSIFTPCTG